MKNTLMAKIKATNHILFFLGSLFFLIFVTYQVYDKNFRDRHSTHNSIRVVSADSKSAKSAEFKMHFINKYEDTFVFRVTSDRIMNVETQPGTRVENFNMFTGAEFDDFESVNFLFTGTDAEPNFLLNSHSLIIDYRLIRLEPLPDPYFEQHKMSKHLFEVVLQDSNNDGVLDSDDNINLLASDADGAGIITVARNIVNYTSVDDDTLLVCLRKGNEKVFEVYDLVTGISRKLDTGRPSALGI